MNNPLSFSSVKLDLFSRDGTRLKPASGLMLEVDNRHYLITNRQVLSDRNMEVSNSEEPGLKPYILKTSIHSYTGEGEQPFPLSMGMRKRITVRLYDDNDTPTWMECRGNERQASVADVVALPVPLNETFRFNQHLRLYSQKGPETLLHRNYWSKISAISIAAIDTDVEYGPSDMVHVIGYPLGWAPEGTDRTSSAFWRTSFIASEIHEAGTMRSDTFFIDPCPPEGMTGSPVIGMKKDRVKLLGVYSDLSTREFGANAGLVYGSWLVKGLISAS